MHTFDTRTARFFHDKDFEGEVRIVAMLAPVGGPDPAPIFVEFDDIKRFVAEYIRHEKMQELEAATSDELLLGCLLD
jgi:hypothetical protein